MKITFTTRHISNIERELEVPGYYSTIERVYFIDEKDHVYVDNYGVSKFGNCVLGAEELGKMEPISYSEFVEKYNAKLLEIAAFYESGKPSILNSQPYVNSNIQEDHD